MEHHEWLGTWWRPDAGSEIGGQLVIDDHGVTLELLGSLVDSAGLPLEEPRRLPIIHGLSSGRPISVLDAYRDSRKHAGDRVSSESWRASAVVEAALDGDAEPTFTGARFEVEGLSAWAQARRVAVRWVDDRRTEITVGPHELASAQLGSGERVLIEQATVTNITPRDYHIRQPVAFAVEEAEPTTWTRLLDDWLRPLEVLLWIATGDTGHLERIDLRLPDDDCRARKWGRLWVPLVEPTRRNPRNLTERDVLFHAGSLPRGFGRALGNWLILWRELRHVLGPLHATASAPSAYADDRFSTAAAAVEAYHRYCVDSERDLPRVEHEDRVALLCGVLTEHAPDLRDWAVEAARPFNRVSFRRRITEIASHLDTLSTQLFGDKLDMFAREVEARRNDLAHARDHDHRTDEGELLHFFAEALVWLLRACVMIDLGFSLDDAQSRVVRHKGFEWTARCTRDLLNRPDRQGNPTTRR